MADLYDVLAVAAHPDDLEVVMGGTAAKLVDQGLRVLFVDLSSGESARHAPAGVRHEQAQRAARLLGVERVALGFHDRLIADCPETRLAVARLIRAHRPRMVFTTAGCGVHPDHKATTDITVNAVQHARLPKWDDVRGGDALRETEPHEIDRLFLGHCRMEAAWERFDFAVDVTGVYDRKLAALACYEAVFSGDQRELLDRYAAEDPLRRNSRRRGLRGAVLGKTKRGKGSKIMAVADRAGLPLAISIASASPHEVTLVEPTLDACFLNTPPARLIGDKAYGSDRLDERLRTERGVELIAPHRDDRRRRTQDGRPLRRVRRRWKVERLHAWLQNFRRLVTRYE